MLRTINSKIVTKISLLQNIREVKVKIRRMYKKISKLRMLITKENLRNIYQT